MDLEEVLIMNQIFDDLVEAEGDLLRPQRHFFRKEDAFQLSHPTYIKSFRLTKQMTRELINILTPFLEPPSRKSALSLETKILIALNFYGHGTYQEGVGKNIFTAVSQASVSRSINEVTNALNTEEVKRRFIKFPQNINELQQLRTRFYRKYQFPGVVGCIDCTHVAIVAPSEDEHVFVNRKKYHSLNVQLVCDENLKIMNVNPRYPGSTHDSFIWRQSNISTVMENIYRTYREHFFLIGDSGYPPRPWLQTVITNPIPSPEERMNNKLKSVRSIIERCNGVLKNRFRCLLRHRVLHYEPATASKIVTACVILHNMCIDNNIPEADDDNIDFDFGMYAGHENIIDENDEVVARINPDLMAGRQLQREIIRVHFTN